MSIPDRTAAIVSGTSLVIYGALKRSPASAIAIGIGGVIAYLGLRTASAPTPVARQVFRASHTMEAEPYDAFVHWQDLTRLPSVMQAVRGAKKLDNGNWRLSLPGGVGHWDVQITNEQPGHVIEWRSVEAAPFDGRGIIRFTRKKNGRGTKVHMEIAYGDRKAEGKAAPEPVTV